MTVRLYKERGEITVFLSLVLAVTLGLLCVIFESSRSQSIKFQNELAMDTALRSCFGEYHKELFETYNLLYIDDSYRSGEADIENVNTHLRDYMKENLDFDTEKESSDFFKINISSSKIENYLLASDHTALPLYSQAVDYMKNYGDLSHVSRISGIRGDIGNTDESDLFAEWDASLARVESFGVSFINPSAVVRGMAASGAGQVTGCRGRSLAALSYGEVPSHRLLKQGNFRNISFQEEELIFTEYLLQNCGSIVHPKSFSVLSCEEEYLLYGKSSDKENLILLVERLIRIFSRRAYESLGAREDEMKSYAESIVPPPRNPEDPEGWFDREALVEAVADSLRYAWAEAEGILKTDRLLGGGRVNASNPSADWIISLKEIMEYRSRLGGAGGSGYTYEEYISVFLQEVNRQTICMRFLDEIEMNMRKLGSPGFMVDGCVEYLNMRVDTASSFGYEFNITRDYAYEDRYRKKSL